MIHVKRAVAVACAFLGISAAALAQRGPQGRGNPVSAAVEALGLGSEQVDRIREIRRERPPRDQSREERREWSQEQNERIQEVLTDEQKAKVDELEEASLKMSALAGAAALGLTERVRPYWPSWGADRRGGRPPWFGRGGQRGPRGAPGWRHRGQPRREPERHGRRGPRD